MTLRIPDASEASLLGMALGKTAMELFSLRLYTNNITPGEADVTATYTQATGNGYAAVSLTAANWVLTNGAPCSAAYPQVTFSFTGAAGNIYGYFVVGATSGLLLWAERFGDGPYNITQSGDSIKVTPVITLQDTLD